MRFVDTDTHAWGAGTNELPWQAEVPPSEWDGPYTHADLVADMDALGIEESVIVTTRHNLCARKDRPRQAVARVLLAPSVHHKYSPVGAELTVSYRSLRRRVEQFARTFDVPATDFVGPVVIDEVYISAGKKGRERDWESHSRGLATH